jgi:membrane-associated protease RseP (regulator of RpoE activity)
MLHRSPWLLALALFASPALAQAPPIPPLPPIAPGAPPLVAPAATPDHWVGIVLRDASAALLAQLGLEHGLVAEDVMPDSPASKGGLQRHDVIVAVGDTQIRSGHDLMQAVAEGKDAELEFHVVRNGEKQSLKITPVKRPADQYGGGPPVVRGLPGEAIKRLWRELPGEVGNVEVDVLGPGVLFRSRPITLPEGVRVTIEREGSQPAKVAVKRGEESWEITEKELEKLPNELREPVRAMLGHPPARAFAFGEGAKEEIERQREKVEQERKRALEAFEEQKRKIRELDSDVERSVQDALERHKPQDLDRKVREAIEREKEIVGPRIRIREFNDDSLSRIEQELKELRKQLEELRREKK